MNIADLVKIYEFNTELNESKIIGPNDSNLNIIKEYFHIDIIASSGTIYVYSSTCEDQIAIIKKLFEILEKLLDSNLQVTQIDIINIIKSIENDSIDDLLKVYLKKEIIVTLANGKAIYPKTINQSFYLKCLNDEDVIFGIGPAGTGKTYIAVMYACNQLKKQNIKKIVLVRPAVEAGEKLGFLPGDLKEKVDPYLIPLYDCLEACFGKETLEKMMEKGIVEVAPLAYMRGRTLDNSIIILDEAQNTTLQQMKMFLTRLGFNSKMIITGDMTQIDLLNKKESGLIEASQILKGIRGIKFVNFEKSDVMRNPLVYKIIERYENK